MKTKIIKPLLASMLTVALISTLAAFQTSASEQLKGAQKLVERKAVASLSTTEKATSAMSCTGCKDVATSNYVEIQKGHIQETKTVLKHLCKSCSTSIGVVGTGKDKKNVTNHSCGESNQGPASCCGKAS